jgi:hypothetical protein
MKSRPRLAISVPEGQRVKPLVKAVLIYENFAAGVRARWFCKKFVRLLDASLEETNWSFDALALPEKPASIFFRMSSLHQSCLSS